MKNLKDAVVAVTGCASGTGCALAVNLDERGAIWQFLISTKKV